MSKVAAEDLMPRYATPRTFREIFAESRSSLYRLALLLLGIEGKIEQCIQNALEDCIKANCVFEDFAGSWVRRRIIRTALRVADIRTEGFSVGVQRALRIDGPGSENWPVCNSILALSGVQRFVFVMSALEQYNDRECSVLLRCSHQDVRDARARTSRYLEEICGTDDQTCVARIRVWLTNGSQERAVTGRL